MSETVSHELEAAAHVRLEGRRASPMTGARVTHAASWFRVLRPDVLSWLVGSTKSWIVEGLPQRA